MSDHESRTLSQDVAFDLLSNARRRFVLRHLQERSEPIELGDLAAELAAKENDVPVEELSAQQRKRTYVSLYQTHIPKLVEAGVVTYDSDAGTVHATEQIDDLSAYFRTNSDRVAWELLYAGLAILGLAAYAAVTTVEAFAINPLYVVVIVLGAVALLSVSHYLYIEQLRPNDAVIPLDRGDGG